MCFRVQVAVKCMSNQLTQLGELNSVEQSMICHAIDDLLLIATCMSVPVETQLRQRLKEVNY